MSQDTTEDRLMAEIRALLGELHVGGIDRLRWDSPLADQFGLDSLSTVELQDRIEQAFGVQVPGAELGQVRTPGDWLRAVRKASGSAVPGAPVPPSGPPGALPEKRRPGAPWAEEAETLVDALAWHAERHPEFVGVRLLGDGGDRAVADLSYGTLEAEASICARALLGDGIGRGERVAIMLPTCRDYFVVSMAVMMAGAVPVPIYPPAQLSVLEDHLRRQALLLANSGAAMLVSFPEAMLPARLLQAQVPSLRSVRTAEMLRSAKGPSGPLPVVKSDDIALVQYTSGSTGDPKGVVLTQAQLLANIRAMGEAAEVDSADLFVSWLPLYHDIGLIGAWHAASLFFGMLLVIMSPTRFLARPAGWLEAITRYSGTLSAAPNFAYQMCVDRVRESELAGLDLSSWRLTFNGSEPVRATTVDAFCQRFAPAGFRPGTMCPSYGLAEVGVGLTFTPLGRGARVDSVRLAALEHGRAEPALPGEADTVELVSNGRTLPGYEVRVADEAGRAVPERHAGRVECRGPSATAGYFANAEATRALYDDGWLDTGDAGYLADGELYLTGRVKDIIDRAGRKLHPEELEQGLEQLPGLHPEAVAVFGVDDPARGSERLVVAAEVNLASPAEEADLRAAIGRRSLELVGVRPDEIVLLPAGAIVRTASGKVRRQATSEAFVAGTLGRRPAPALVQLARLAWSGRRPQLALLHEHISGLLYAVRVWSAVVAVAVPVWLAVLLPSSRAVRWRLARAAGRLLQKAAGIDLQVHGALPGPASPAVVVANHSSFVDGLVLLLASVDPLVFVSSTDFERQAIAGTFLRRLGCTFVHRDEPDKSQADLDHLVALIRGGARLAVFPEGSLTGSVGVDRFHLGAFAVAGAAGCPVIPVGIRGSRLVLRPGRYLPHRAPVEVHVGPSLEPSGTGFTAAADLAERARHAVGELVGEPLIG